MIFAFDLSQFLAQASSFGAILFRFKAVLLGGDAPDCMEKLGQSIVLAFAGMFQLIGKIVLVLRVALQSGNAALKILNCRPALSPRDGSVGDTGIGCFLLAKRLSKAARVDQPNGARSKE